MRVRPFDPGADLAAVVALWEAALAPGWPVLPESLYLLRRGFVAVDGDGRPAGVAIVDPVGSLLLVLVAPWHQRRGIGSALVAAALRDRAAAGVTEVRTGSGGAAHIWPGVPLDLPGAVAFFGRAGGGWQVEHDVADLVANLCGYRPPPDVYARTGVRCAPATRADLAEVLAFEDAAYPQWTRFFHRSPAEILLARDAAGSVVGTLLFQGPDSGDTFYRPLLGAAVGTIGCVGVAPHAHGRGIGSAMVAFASELLRDRGTRMCQIGLVEREAFYSRVGYLPWRRYRIFRHSTDATRDGA